MQVMSGTEAGQFRQPKVHPYCFRLPAQLFGLLRGTPGLGQGTGDCRNQSCGGDGIMRDARIFSAVLLVPRLSRQASAPVGGSGLSSRLVS